MQEYTHNPTKVQAIQVARPFRRVEDAVPKAHRVTNARGAFEFFTITVGELKTARAYEGDWILRYPTGCWAVQTDEQFQRYYGDQDVDGNTA